MFTIQLSFACEKNTQAQFSVICLHISPFLSRANTCIFHSLKSLLPFSEKIVPFGIASAAQSVFVVGNWPPLPIGEDEEEEEEREEEGEMERESRLARNEGVRERVRNENFITFI